jgi:threonine dehydrogenase-like Zn-dependent dehydrogenase
VNEITVALIAAGPAGLAAWAAFTAARRSAQRDLAGDRQQVLAEARKRAQAADAERHRTRQALLELENSFDRLRSVVRRLVDALAAHDDTDPALEQAQQVLEDLAP